MKIAMIGAECIPTKIGGVSRHVEEVGSRVGKKYAVTAYVRSKNRASNEFKNMKIKTCSVGSAAGIWIFPSYLRATLSAIKEKKDIIHYHGLTSALFCFIPKLFGKKVVVTLHGLTFVVKNQKQGFFFESILKLSEKIVAAYADEIIAVSRTLQSAYERARGRKPVFIPNGIKIKKKLKPDLITQNGLKRKNYFLFVGRICYQKSVCELVEAFNKIKTSKKLVIAGAAHNREYGKKTKKAVQGNKNIVFLGVVTGKKLDELYSNTAAFILPSRWEGLSCALLEAVSFGSPIIASDIPQNREVLDGAGLYVVPGNKKSIKEKLKKALKNQKTCCIPPEKAQKILKKYDWNRIAKKTEKIYNNLF